MAQSTTPADDTLAHLTRLSQKPGVRSTLIISRATGAIVRASGLVSVRDQNASTDVELREDEKKDLDEPGLEKSFSARDTEGTNTRVNENGRLTSAEEVAKLVLSFFGAAGGVVQGLAEGRRTSSKDAEETGADATVKEEEEEEEEDEVKLLRLRTTKSEIVVVPDSKYLLVVIHDTPKA